jgi:O-antigen/teichoic acid export membrane protein
MASLLRNVGVNMAGFVAGKLAAAVTGILLLRALQPEASGIYGAAIGFAALFQSLADLGLGACLIREVGGHPRHADQWFSRGLYAQLAQTAVAGLALTVFLWLGGPGDVQPGLVALAFGIPALASLSTPVASTLQGLERFGLQGLTATAASLLNALALACLLLWGKASPQAALAASVGAAALGVLLWAWAAWKGGLRLRHARLDEVTELWRRSLPFALLTVVNQLFVRVNQAILVWILGSAALGPYVAAVRLVDLMVPVLSALNGPLYARLSLLLGPDGRQGDQARQGRENLARALRFMAALGLPLAVGGSILAGPLMRALYGDAFASGTAALVWLAWVPALIGISANIYHGLNALHLTGRLARFFIFNLGLNIGLNLLLIPRFGFAASAAVAVLCELANLSYAWHAASRAGMGLSLRRSFWPALPAALGMGATLAGLLLWSPLSSLGPALQASLGIGIGAAAYAGLLWVLGFFGPDERLQLGRMWRRA